MQPTHCRLWPWCILVFVCRIYVSRRRCVGRYACCSYGVVWGVEGGGGLPVRRHSYGGHRVELWRASDEKQLKVKQSRQTRVYLVFFRPKTGTTRFGPMAGRVGCGFDLILELLVFYPKRPKVYLFLAAAYKNTTRSPVEIQRLTNTWTIFENSK